VQFVQEQLAWPCVSLFVPDYWPFSDLNWDTAPTMDFRFSKFYAHPNWYHVWAGYEETCWFLYSPDSLVEWRMRDCELHGGRVNLGPPDDGYFYGAPIDWEYGQGAVSWVNNLFDNVAVTLNPSYYWLIGATNCDMTVTVRHNLFRGGRWLCLSPVPATAGPWVFTDNLFDKVNFAQDTNAPLDFSHNGYWSLHPSELQWAALVWSVYHWHDGCNYPILLPNASQLTPVLNGGGSNEVALAFRPPYQIGPFGNYYLPTNWPPYNAGSRSYAEAGLAHYTTRLDQVKEMDETSDVVNIGLHYVATSGPNSAQPRDTDGDGIPDYVEDSNGNGQCDPGETDLHNTQTEPGIPDPTNTVYDDIDLDGDGMVGRVEKVLFKDPLVWDNPFSLAQVIVGTKPDNATFKVPVDYEFLSSVGEIELCVSGSSPEVQACYKDPLDNSVRLVWNTTFESPGQYFLQPRFWLNAVDSNFGRAKTVASGPLLPFLINNAVQFNLDYATFTDSGVTLFGKTVPGAQYAIEIHAPDGPLLRTITGSLPPESDEIIESWDLICDDPVRTVYNGDWFIANFTITDGTLPAQTHRAAFFRRSGLGYADGNFTIAYSWHTFSGDPAQPLHWCIQTGVVDPLLQTVDMAGQPAPPHPYGSTFNRDSISHLFGDPGYIDSPTRVAELLDNLSEPATRNFYWLGHGTPNLLYSELPGVSIPATLVTERLGNSTSWFWTEGPGSFLFGRPPQHPYRFVFLDACWTGADPKWARAFGIKKRITYSELASTPEKAQAFLGWSGIIFTPASHQICLDYQKTLAFFFNLWQLGFPLDQCVEACSNFGSPGFPYDPWYLIDITIPLGLPQNFYQYYGGRKGDDPGSYTRIYGYPGITRTGVVPRP